MVTNALRIGLPLGAILLAIFLCETYGIAHTSAANAAFLISLCIVLTPLVEWLLLKQRPDQFTMGAALVAMLGAALLSRNLNAALNWGDALILAAALLRAVMMVETKRRCAGQTLSTLALTAVQAGVLMLGCLLLALLTPSGLPALPTSRTFWLATLFLVLFCTLFAFFAQNYAIRRSTPSRVALLLGTEPVFGALFAALVLGETLSANVIIGGALIVLASLAASVRPQSVKLALKRA
jgi:drug/metabolite transporter (DMT)-like permease